MTSASSSSRMTHLQPPPVPGRRMMPGGIPTTPPLLLLLPTTTSFWPPLLLYFSILKVADESASSFTHSQWDINRCTCDFFIRPTVFLFVLFKERRWRTCRPHSINGRAREPTTMAAWSAVLLTSSSWRLRRLAKVFFSWFVFFSSSLIKSGINNWMDSATSHFIAWELTSLEHSKVFVLLKTVLHLDHISTV